MLYKFWWSFTEWRLLKKTRKLAGDNMLYKCPHSINEGDHVANDDTVTLQITSEW